MVRRAAAVLLVVAGPVWPCAATAADGASAPVHVLLWPEVGAPPQPAVEDRLREGLRPRVPAVFASEPMAHAPDIAARRAADGADVGRVEAALAEARKAYLAFDFDDARTRLLALREADLAVLTLPAQGNLLGEVERLLAQVELAAGRREAAEDAVRLAVQILPDAPRGGLAPEYAQMEVEMRSALYRAGMRPLRIDSDPVGADVLVDGRRLGVAPITVDVPVGAHVVRVESPGRAVLARVVTVETAGLQFEARLPPDADDPVLLRRIGRDAVDPADQPSREALLARAGATHLVSYRAQGGHLTARVWLPAAADAITVGPRRLDEPTFVRQVGDAILGIRQEAAAPLPTPEPGPAAATAPYKTWWFWAAIVAGVGAAVGGAAYVTANRPQQHALVRPQ